MFSATSADKLKIVMFRSGCAYRTHLENIFAKRGIVGVRRLDFGTLEGILGCVGAGIGLTLLPRVVVEVAASEGRVAIHRLPPSEACVPTVLIRHRDLFVSTALMRFIELARLHLADRRAERQQTLPTPFNRARPVPLPVASTLSNSRTALRRRRSAR